jgi:hypothetical protein
MIHLNKKKGGDPNERIKKLTSNAIFEVNFKYGFFGKQKTFNLKIWYTPNKIVIIEPKKLPIELPFKEGDHFDEVFKWAEENGHDLIYIKKKGKGSSFY